jgi:hypothetical protein
LRTRRLLLGAGAVVLLALAGLLAWVACPRAGVTRANYERIREGMTRRQVEALLGGPADDLAERGQDLPLLLGPDEDALIGDLWAGEEATIIVAFGSDGRVARKQLVRALPEESLRDRLRRLLPW